MICIILASLTGVKNGRNVAMLRIIMQTLLKAVVKGLRENVLVLKATIANQENGRRQRKRAKSTTRIKVIAKHGTPESIVVITVRKKAHVKSGTPGSTAVITVRNKAHAKVGTPENTAVVTVRNKAHAEAGTPEDIAVVTVRNEAHAEAGTPEHTAVNTVRRINATGSERELIGPEFLTPVE